MTGCLMNNDFLNNVEGIARGSFERAEQIKARKFISL
jgi:hypothetical protein